MNTDTETDKEQEVPPGTTTSIASDESLVLDVEASISDDEPQQVEEEQNNKVVIEPLDTEEATFNGKQGHWLRVVFPPYFSATNETISFEENEQTGQLAMDIPPQTFKVEPEPLHIFLEKQDSYPGFIKIQPRSAEAAVKDSLGRKATIQVIPQNYTLKPPTDLYKNISESFVSLAYNLPRYRRVVPIEFEEKGFAGKNQDGEDGLWYVVHIPSAEVPFHGKDNSNSKEGEEEEVVTVTHKPVGVFVPSGIKEDGQNAIHRYAGPIELKTEDECAVWLKNQQDGSFKQVTAKLGRRLFRFWPPFLEGQTVADHRRNKFASVENSGYLEFVAYLD